MTDDLHDRLDRFLAGLPEQAVLHEAARRSGRPEQELASLLQTFRNEARATLNVVEMRLCRQLRMLEVGAGLCLFSLFLQREGYNITALEPALGGFGAFDALRDALLAEYPGHALPLLTIPAGELDAREHGRFDLIFSNNVVEHIPAWQAAFVAMLGVLQPDGAMLHACPNYSVPYEPHYGVPVLRRLPNLSRRLFLPAVADAEIWQSLNFICHRQVRRFATEHDCRVAFERELIYRALARLQQDVVFRQRHQGLVTKVADMLAATGLLGLLRHLPPAMATPMVFSIRHRVAEE